MHKWKLSIKNIYYKKEKTYSLEVYATTPQHEYWGVTNDRRLEQISNHVLEFLSIEHVTYIKHIPKDVL